MIDSLKYAGNVYDVVMNDIANDRASFPRVPSHVIQIDRLVRDESKSMKDLARLIEAEPSLTARIMQIANSSFYSSINKTNTLQGAIARLGMKMVRNVIMALAIRDVFKSPDAYINNYLGVLWKRSVETAAFATVLAKRNRGDIDVATIGGILHDIGSLAVVGYWFAHGKKQNENKELLCSVVAPFLSCSLGNAVLTEWNFPSELVDVIQKQCDHDSVDPVELNAVDFVIASKCYFQVGASIMTIEEFNLIPSVVKLQMNYDSMTELLNEVKDLCNEFSQPFLA